MTRRLGFLLLLLCASVHLQTGTGSSAVFDRESNPVRLRRQAWKCADDFRCLPTFVAAAGEATVTDDEGGLYGHLEGCKSVCGKYGSLWPRPTGGDNLRISRRLNAFQLDDIAVKFDLEHLANSAAGNVDDLEQMLSDAWVAFSQNIQSLEEKSGEEAQQQNSPPFEKENSGNNRKKHQVLVKITVESTASLEWTLSTDREAYSLIVLTRMSSGKPRDDMQVFVKAASYYGAFYALETLSQLVTFRAGTFYLPATVKLSDKPVYAYRGVMVDTSRNFYSVESLKRIVDGMGYNKLNVFHWHMTDAAAFPFVSQRVPNMTKHGAYSQREVYYPKEIQQLVAYARARGVLVMPELDTPSHAALGWQWGPEAGLGNLTSCTNDLKWVVEDTTFGMGASVQMSASPPPGQINPLNTHVYQILADLYKDFVDSFTTKKHTDLPLFHMGGDEINFECWARDPEIRKWMVENRYKTPYEENRDGYIQLWSQFQRKAHQKLNQAYNQHQTSTTSSATTQSGALNGTILWSSELTKPFNLHKHVDRSKYIVQVWTKASDELIPNLLSSKYRVILSNWDAWYLDCGFDAWVWNGVAQETNWCSPFKGWKTVYMNSPCEIARASGVEPDVVSEFMLGGEVTMWSEQADEHSVEAKLWPRGAAFAERMWAEPEGSNAWKKAEQRLLEQRRRMTLVRGLGGDAMMPEFCRQRDGLCFAPRPMGGLPVAAAEAGAASDANGGGGAPQDALMEAMRRHNYELKQRLSDADSQAWMRWIAISIAALIVGVCKRRAVLSGCVQIIDAGRNCTQWLRRNFSVRFIAIR